MGSTRHSKRSARSSERSEESAGWSKDKILRFDQDDGCFAQHYRAQFEKRHKINARQQMATIGE